MRESYNNGQWTQGRFRGFIASALRAAMRGWIPKYDAKKLALVGRRLNPKTGKLAQHFECASCKQAFVDKDVQVDHKNPVVDPKVGFVDWETYMDRLYCEVSNLQVLCKKCHKEKTASERLLRKKKE